LNAKLLTAVRAVQLLLLATQATRSGIKLAREVRELVAEEARQAPGLTTERLAAEALRRVRASNRPEDVEAFAAEARRIWDRIRSSGLPDLMRTAQSAPDKKEA